MTIASEKDVEIAILQISYALEALNGAPIEVIEQARLVNADDREIDVHEALALLEEALDCLRAGLQSRRACVAAL